MSLEWMTWAYKQRAGGPGPKAVLLALCNYGNPINVCDKALMEMIPEPLHAHVADLGYSWPSQQLLMDMTEMSESTVRRHINTLEERDLVLSFERRRPNGRKSSDGYLLITSPVILTGSDFTGQNDGTSPVNLTATYEEPKGLEPKDGIKTLLSSSVNKPPLPPVTPLRWTDELTEADWRLVRGEAVGKLGALSVEYLADQYERWVMESGNYPRNVLNHFLSFIQSHKRRNKL